MAIPTDINNRLKAAIIESSSVANQAAMAVVNPDGSSIGSSTSGVGTQAVATATIANGASLSDEVDLAGYRNVALIMPSAWTAANITFQASDVTGGTYVDVYDSAGNELTIIASASKVLTDIPELSALRFIKIRSGTTGTPVNQGGSRAIKVIEKG